MFDPHNVQIQAGDVEGNVITLEERETIQVKFDLMTSVEGIRLTILETTSPSNWFIINELVVHGVRGM